MWGRSQVNILLQFTSQNDGEFRNFLMEYRTNFVRIKNYRDFAVSETLSWFPMFSRCDFIFFFQYFVCGSSTLEFFKVVHESVVRQKLQLMQKQVHVFVKWRSIKVETFNLWFEVFSSFVAVSTNDFQKIQKLTNHKRNIGKRR